MAYYRDLRDHVAALEAHQKLVRIKRPINKDTELYPLVRWQFRGLPEEKRKAFLFENVTDVTEKHYRSSVLLACHAASREVYAISLMCQPAEIADRWARAQLSPLEPEIVRSGPVQEEIHLGPNLLEHGGIEEFPVPIVTPGFDNAPYFSAANFMTKDPDTGARNIGNYRAMVKSRDRLGVCSEPPQHLRVHWERCKARGVPLPAAIVIGASPNIGLTATAKLPYGKDEVAVAGGLSGSAVQLVKCQTIDLEVPATAEIVIEGLIPTDSLEREAPFGEFSGFMGMEKISPYFNVTCICHRHNPIYNAFMGEFPPSEATKLRQLSNEAIYYKFLKHDCNIPGILGVTFLESCAGLSYTIIRMRKSHPSAAWQALNGCAALNPQYGKITIVVDDDIDPEDQDSVNWALTFRMQPERDVKIISGRVPMLDPSGFPPTEQDFAYYSHPGSAILIDATRKWDYPPVSLPRKDFMEKAKKIWEEEGLPTLTPRTPWFGYSLGFWSDQNQAEAELALRGAHYETGEKLARERIKLDANPGPGQ
ncbi:MAG: UbiD family decarboxylase [Chloroflexi bacterium]|nr:UbiD family decarboxylase [Chloroflexota bacterium]